MKILGLNDTPSCHRSHKTNKTTASSFCSFCKFQVPHLTRLEISTQLKLTPFTSIYLKEGIRFMSTKINKNAVTVFL